MLEAKFWENYKEDLKENWFRDRPLFWIPRTKKISRISWKGFMDSAVIQK